jgi:hypothetical protein
MYYKPRPVVQMYYHERMVETLSDLIQIRVSEQEKAAWLEAAQREDLTLAEWVRRRCRGDESVAVFRRAERIAETTKRPSPKVSRTMICEHRLRPDQYCPRCDA